MKLLGLSIAGTIVMIILILGLRDARETNTEDLIVEAVEEEAARVQDYPTSSASSSELIESNIEVDGANSTPDVAPEQKLDRKLLTLVQNLDRSKVATNVIVNQALSDSGLEHQDGFVYVEIIGLTPSSLAHLKGRVVEAGGEVVSELENHLYARIQATLVRSIATEKTVWSMASPPEAMFELKTNLEKTTN